MNRRLKASVTVEAAFIFPIVVFVIITILLMALYVSDVVGVRAIVQKYSVTGCDSDISAEKLAAKMEGEIRNSLLVADLKTVKASDKDSSRSIEVEIAIQLGFFNIYKKDTIKEKMYVENNRQSITKQKIIIDTARVQQ